MTRESHEPALDVDYNGTMSPAMTWRQLRALIDALPETSIDRAALICSDAPSPDNPYQIMGLMTDHGGWGPMLIQEH